MPLLTIPFPAIDPIAVSLGPFAIRWYALAYIVGLLIGWRYCLMLADRAPQLIGRKEIDDFLVWATLGVVLGGRVGFVLFYNLPFYIDHPLQMFELWHGGMSFHGGALGVTIAIIVFCRQRGLSIFALSDIVIEAIPIGLFFGRIANFINGELWGRMTDTAWAIIYPGGAVSANQVPPNLLGLCQNVTFADGSPGFNCPRHPSELYEAACEGVLLFLLLLYFEHRGVRRRPGIETGIFLIGYAIARTSGELFRQPDAQLGFLFYIGGFGVTMGQLLSIPVLIAGAVIIWWMQREPAAAASPR
ncbi:MAG TPA: prolipoprotein diacylglyceryl transferase [Stellaceae bacterium]|jgi:phosphatidylglycerol:prolipoprotein diacylglycerol transferase|nr:prolipoprotein diacylglyceryl transferase [Stellaceae bacterium]